MFSRHFRFKLPEEEVETKRFVNLNNKESSLILSDAKKRLAEVDQDLLYVTNMVVEYSKKLDELRNEKEILTTIVDKLKPTERLCRPIF